MPELEKQVHKAVAAAHRYLVDLYHGKSSPIRNVTVVDTGEDRDLFLWVREGWNAPMIS